MHIEIPHSVLRVSPAFLSFRLGLLTAFAVTTLAASGPAAADEPASQAPAAAIDDAGAKEEPSRREARRLAREAEQEQAAAAARSESVDAAGEAAAEPELVVVVEPQMECRRVTVSGSRIPQEVCSPVQQQSENAKRDQEQVQDFQRRQAERATITPQRDNPFTNANLPGF